jgi:hypothetical protein
LAIQEGPKRDRVGLNEIAEDVHVPAVGHGADFDSRNEPDASRARCADGGIGSAGRIVICDADDGQAGRTGLVNELRRRERAVGGGRVKVKIDQRVVRR